MNTDLLCFCSLFYIERDKVILAGRYVGVGILYRWHWVFRMNFVYIECSKIFFTALPLMDILCRQTFMGQILWIKSSVLPLSLSNGFLPSPACDWVHVRGAGHTKHQWTDQTTDRLPACQVHQGNKRWVHTQYSQLVKQGQRQTRTLNVCESVTQFPALSGRLKLFQSDECIDTQTLGVAVTH